MSTAATSPRPTDDRDEDCILWNRYAMNPTPELRQQLLDRSVPLVRQVARAMAARLPAHVEVDELVSSGAFGLIAAASHFSPARKTRFATYARTRIKGAILDELREQDWAPRSIRQKLRALDRAEGELTAELRRPPLQRELCARLGLCPEELARLERARVQLCPSSLDEPRTDEEDGPCLHDTVEDTRHASDPEHAAHRTAVRQSMARALNRLTVRERLVLQLKYFEELTTTEIAAVLEVSDSRISQLHTRALERLRELLAAEARELQDSL